ncbi:rhomboid family intramembrane serine protease [Paracoccus sp. MC1862]|uniref:rhomboid family intramembrane serine protease n=1 Tax=Paracoccus sp. MC1862 TaxID=2760307 RepID=UPI0016005E3E|nr:rhomboid family intramembrane serine protease [Paracoccus sp. MC1862]MBB1497001.1 rhomboid family intramembrane serine protease [Paracoccus sp. MC1862]QQO44589.1 rhomboid family intramembrane serine protease [Paracoccus sp. MC1862]
MTDRIDSFLRPSVPRAFMGVIVACVAVHLLTLSPALREWAMLHGALWPQLLQDVRPMFPGQQVTMFLTYGFLHGGLLHLGMNMLALYVLARSLSVAMRGGAMVALYVVAQVVAGVVQLWLSDSPYPVVGASGAIFGLAGAEIAIAARIQLAKGGSLRLLAGPVLQFVLLNVALTLAVPNIAWQAHLGGALAGVVIGALYRPRLRR